MKYNVGCALYTRKNHHDVASCQQVVQRLLRSGCSNVVGAAFNNPGYQFVPRCQSNAVPG